MPAVFPAGATQIIHASSSGHCAREHLPCFLRDGEDKCISVCISKSFRAPISTGKGAFKLQEMLPQRGGKQSQHSDKRCWELVFIITLFLFPLSVFCCQTLQHRNSLPTCRQHITLGTNRLPRQMPLKHSPEQKCSQTLLRLGILTTGPGIPRRPSGPGFPGAPWGPIGPVFPGGPSKPASPCTQRQRGLICIGPSSDLLRDAAAAGRMSQSEHNSLHSM